MMILDFQTGVLMPLPALRRCRYAASDAPWHPAGQKVKKSMTMGRSSHFVCINYDDLTTTSLGIIGLL